MAGWRRDEQIEVQRVEDADRDAPLDPSPGTVSHPFTLLQERPDALDPVSFHLHDVLDGLNRVLAPTARERGLGYLCRVAPGVPERLRGDWTRISRILICLLGNAVEFTRAGRIALNVSLVEETDGKAMLEFSVTDTGVGIPQERLEEIYEELTVPGSIRARGYEDWGWGLAMATRQAEILGGSIVGQSREGEGSAFSLRVMLEVWNGSGNGTAPSCPGASWHPRPWLDPRSKVESP